MEKTLRLPLIALAIIGAASAVAAGTPHDPAPSEHSTAVAAPAYCFAPGTPREVVERAQARARFSLAMHSLSPESPPDFVLGSRWSFTATDGGGLGQGDPTTVTWSVVPDGTSITGGIGEPAAGSGLRSFLNGIYGNEATWRPIFQQVFDRWGQLTGVTYVYEPSDDGAGLPGAGGVVGVRGDVRISGHPIDGNAGILAYNYYPNTGDMVIDSPDSWFNDTSSNSLKLRNVLAHEHGHGLGLRHSCPRNQTKLMEPYLTTAFDGPQHDDVLAANRGYGDPREHNDTPATADALGAVGSTTLSDLSVDDNMDTDLYSLWAGNGKTVDITVTPIGATYLAGPQNSDGSCSAGTPFNSLSIHDLAIRVLDTDGITELAAANLNGVGLPEVLTEVALSSGAGIYYVEIAGDATDAAQMYELALAVSASSSVFGDGFESGNTNAWSATSP